MLPFQNLIFDVSQLPLNWDEILWLTPRLYSLLLSGPRHRVQYPGFATHYLCSLRPHLSMPRLGFFTWRVSSWGCIMIKLIINTLSQALTVYIIGVSYYGWSYNLQMGPLTISQRCLPFYHSWSFVQIVPFALHDLFSTENLPIFQNLTQIPTLPLKLSLKRFVFFWVQDNVSTLTSFIRSKWNNIDFSIFKSS